MAISIAFHIPRMNWYRVLSSPINEAMKRKWNVQCWHNTEKNQKLKENQPDKNRVPLFKYGQPEISEYDGNEGLNSLIRSKNVQAVIDADPLTLEPIKIFSEKLQVDLKCVLIDGISSSRLQQDGRKYPQFDLYATPSVWHIDSTIKIRTRNHLKEISRANDLIGKKGNKIIEEWKRLYTHEWNENEISYYREHSTVTGTPSLDELDIIDPDNVRRKWGVSSSKNIVGYLPTPWDMPLGYFWGDYNMAKSYLKAIYVLVKYKQLKYLKFITKNPRDINLVKAIKKFCTKNNALLVAKLRHSRQPKKYLLKLADIIIGEDGYYPHTALELYKTSNIVIGYTSTGALECVAAKTPYIDIELPFLPKKYVIEFSTPATEVTCNWPGVVTSLNATDAVRYFKKTNLDNIKMDIKEREKYLQKYSSNCDGKASERLINKIEEVIMQKSKN